MVGASVMENTVPNNPGLVLAPAGPVTLTLGKAVSLSESWFPICKIRAVGLNDLR